MITTLRSTIVSAIAVSGILAFGLISTATAQCGTSPRQNAGALNIASTSAIKLAGFGQPDSTGKNDVSTDVGSLVGLWDIKFIVNGQLFDELFDQFHSDGNEVAIDIVPPVTGNVCVGVWKQVGRTYNVFHPYWIFDVPTNTVLIGKGLITAQLQVNSKGDKLSGNVQIKFRDLSGNPIPGFDDTEGTVVGERITVK